MTPPTTTTTRTRPEVVTRGVPAARPAWAERVASADHKVTGLLFLGTAFTFLALAATEFFLMRLQLIVPENSMIEPQIFNRLLSAGTVTFVVLFALPAAIGLMSYLLPLQIGARSTALPRLGQLSYWLYAFGALVIYASFLYAVPETGSVALPPLSELAFSPSNGADAWIAGTALALGGFVCFAVNMLATVAKMRAPGLAWKRVPLFTWAGTVINVVLLVIGPVMIAALAMLMVDRHFDGIFFEAGEGGAPLLYQHLAYLFLTGCYAIVVLFAGGVVSEVLPTFARKPIFSHRAATLSFVAIAALGLLAWMQNMYAAPLNEGWTIAAMLFALALTIPVGALLYNWIATLWGGALRLRAAAWYAIAAISTMACGLAGELAYSVIPVGWALDNTTASQGDTIYVLVGGGVFGGFAALHYWYPKLSARLLGEGVGKGALLAMFIGIHLYVIPMFFAGLEGQPVDVFKYYEGTGVAGYNLIASIGAFILVGGILVQLGNAAYSWNNGNPARGHDPWGAPTLEWFATSPPPPHNFDVVPDVRSAEPLYDIRDAIRRRSNDFTGPEPLERVEPAPSAAAEGAGDTPPPQQDAPAPPAPEGSAPEPAQSEAPLEASEVEAQPEAPGQETPQTPEADDGGAGGEDEPGTPR